MRERSREGSPFNAFLETIMAHRKVLVPVVLIVSVALTVAVALLLSRPADPEQTAQGEGAQGTEISETSMTVSQDPAINELINRYYAARAAGDLETLESIIDGLTQSRRLYHQELSRYVESFTVEEIYLKQGPVENSYIAYIVEQYKFYDHPQTVPSMESLYIRMSEDGSYYIYDGELDDETNRYIRMSSLSDDVVDLNNKINAEYNEMMLADVTLDELISAVHKSVNDTVAEALAAEQNALAGENSTEEEKPEGDIYLRAREVINIRAEASTESEAIGTTVTGTAYRVLSQDGEWSCIEYNGGQAYVFTEYFDEITEAEARESMASAIDTGTHVMNTSCNIREDSTTDSEIVGFADEGHEVEVLEVLDNGWSRIRYGQVEGFVMTEFIGE